MARGSHAWQPARRATRTGDDPRTVAPTCNFERCSWSIARRLQSIVAVTGLQAFKPADEIEGMLAAQTEDLPIVIFIRLPRREPAGFDIELISALLNRSDFDPPRGRKASVSASPRRTTTCFLGLAAAVVSDFFANVHLQSRSGVGHVSLPALVPITRFLVRHQHDVAGASIAARSAQL